MKEMSNHVSDRLYQHTNAFTNVFEFPKDPAKLDRLLVEAKAIMITRDNQVFNSLRSHVYFTPESKAEGHIGYFHGVPVFVPQHAYKTGAPMRVVTNLTRTGYEDLGYFQQ